MIYIIDLDVLSRNVDNRCYIGLKTSINVIQTEDTLLLLPQPPMAYKAQMSYLILLTLIHYNNFGGKMHFYSSNLLPLVFLSSRTLYCKICNWLLIQSNYYLGSLFTSLFFIKTSWRVQENLKVALAKFSTKG